MHGQWGKKMDIHCVFLNAAAVLGVAFVHWILQPTATHGRQGNLNVSSVRRVKKKTHPLFVLYLSTEFFILSSSSGCLCPPLWSSVSKMSEMSQADSLICPCFTEEEGYAPSFFLFFFLSFKKDGCLCLCRRRCSTSCLWRGARRSRFLCTARTAPSSPPPPWQTTASSTSTRWATWCRPTTTLSCSRYVPAHTGVVEHICGSPVDVVGFVIVEVLLQNVAFVVSGVRSVFEGLGKMG